MHGVCIVSVAELKEILEVNRNSERNLFHSKYFMEVDYVVMDCMEERLVARNKVELKND